MRRSLLDDMKSSKLTCKGTKVGLAATWPDAALNTPMMGLVRVDQAGAMPRSKGPASPPSGGMALSACGQETACCRRVTDLWGQTFL